MIRPVCLADLVSLDELGEAFAALERARRDRAIARTRLMAVRETLDRVLDEAFRRQSFAPLEHLFRREEMALGRYDGALRQMAQARQRWNAVLAAFAHECHVMGSDLPPVGRLN
jgi:hypothetical protein